MGPIYFHNRLIHLNKDEYRTLALTGSISFVFHMIFFVVLIFASEYDPFNDKNLSVASISVRMVDMPVSSGQEESVASVEQTVPKPEETFESKNPEPEEKPVIEPPPEPEKKVIVESEKPEKEKKPEPEKPKKEEKPEKKEPEKIAPPEEKVIAHKKPKEEAIKPKKPSLDHVHKVIAKLKAQVEKEGKAVDSKGSEGSEGSEGSVGTVGMPGEQPSELIDIYRIEVAHQIQKNWAFPEELAGGDTNLETVVDFLIMPDGEITNVKYNPTGNKYFDASVENAISKSNPVKRHPEGVSKRYIKMSLKFVPTKAIY